MTLQRSRYALTCPSIAAAYKLLVATAIATISAALFFRLRSFPGLHGDEAWVGLRAVEQHARGLFTLRGMNGYTGSLFPEIVTWAASILSPGVLSLRLPGAMLNSLSLLLMTAALWKRGGAALYFLLLMGSSLLFLFYSRVAWEVNALQNFLLALIIFSLTVVLKRDRTSPPSAFLLFLAFSVGTWNHEIFLAAALSFALATTLVALKWPTEDSARLLLLGYFNLVPQVALHGKRLVADGPFPLHALPALVLGFALLVLTSMVYVRAERNLLPTLLGVMTRRPLPHAQKGIAFFIIAGSLLASPTSLLAFFGTVSGIIMLERVVSYTPGPIEMAGLHFRMAALASTFLAIAVNQMRNARVDRQDQLFNVLMIWTITFFPALMLATRGVADRYYIIPQFRLFCSIALAIDHLADRWRLSLQALLVCGFAYAQVTLFREASRDQNRPPLEAFAYGPYTDTSRHFLKLDRLSDYLTVQDICRVESSNFFIAQPIRFLTPARATCRTSEIVEIEYCSNCGGPVEWFKLTPKPAAPGSN